METLVKNYISAYNHFDIPGMLAQLTDDVVFEISPMVKLQRVQPVKWNLQN